MKLLLLLFFLLPPPLLLFSSHPNSTFAVDKNLGEDVQEVEVEVLAVDVVIGAIDDHPLDVVVHDIHLHVALHPVLQLIALHMRTT